MQKGVISRSGSRDFRFIEKLSE